jgi:predicted transcriptional regulator
VAKAGPKRGRGRPKQTETLGAYIATRISADRNDQLVRAAAKAERSPAWIMRRAVEEWLDRNGYKAS